MKFPPSLTAILVSLLAACAGDLPGADNGGGGGGGGAGADAGPTVPTCEQVRPIEFQEALPPDLLLVVDKSGSMDDRILGQQKWGTMRNALNTTLTSNADGINFGLMLYPSNDVCAAGNVNTAVSPTSSANVSSALALVNPDGGTPTHTSLQNALSYYQGAAANANGRYVLLATDGEPNCLDPNEPQISSAVQSVAAITALSNAGIPTFVLGFGNGVNAQTLQAMAVAGGQSQYYAANSPAELQLALDTIADQVALPDCRFVLGEAPADPSRLRLFFDNNEVGRSNQHVEGWDYDDASNAVTIYGSSCEQLQSGAVGEVRVDYGCQGTIID